jgi:anti-anti-sigma regulatory factor
MNSRTRAVAVKQLPEILSARQARIFFSDLESHMNVDRPLIVLDCSKVHKMDRSAVHLLLCCLEEAMKRNGDVKLAALPHGSAEIVGLSRIDRLFEVFGTIAEAVNSFRRGPIDTASHASLTARSLRTAENAA